MKVILFNADDWGLSESIHRAITSLHEKRAIDAAGIMMGQEFTNEAISYSERHKDLRVGIHLFANDDFCKPLTRKHWPAFWPNSMWLNPGLAVPQVRQVAVAEIHAQLKAYKETGLRLDFVNSHFHFHPNPAVDREVLDTIKDLFPNFNGWIRLGETRLYPGHLPGGIMDLILGGLDPVLDAVFNSSWEGLRNDTLWGLNRTFHNQADEITQTVDELSDGFHEFFFHPGRSRRLETNGTDEAALTILADLLPQTKRLPSGFP